MMKKDQLLQLFIEHKGDWLSGNQLANEMNISRKMSWKLINQ